MSSVLPQNDCAKKFFEELGQLEPPYKYTPGCRINFKILNDHGHVCYTVLESCPPQLGYWCRQYPCTNVDQTGRQAKQ